MRLFDTTEYFPVLGVKLDVTHWVVFDIPATVDSLPEGVPADAAVQGGVQGANVHDVNGYQAPCPRGVGHYYVFDLYALDAKVNLRSGASRTDLLKAMQGHIIAQTHESIGCHRFPSASFGLPSVLVLGPLGKRRGK